MILIPTAVKNAFVVEIEKRGDERGFFARAWCSREFREKGLSTAFVQANIGFSTRRGTLRGLHYQLTPHSEAKLVRCTSGAVWDVVLDVRQDSPTFGGWTGAELSAQNHRMLYLPEGCAHGYQALTHDAEIFYLVSKPYAPAAEGGVRYDDPAFGIEWPEEVTAISEKDRSWPDYKLNTG